VDGHGTLARLHVQEDAGRIEEGGETAGHAENGPTP
jgi:hypothetical protein